MENHLRVVSPSAPRMEDGTYGLDDEPIPHRRDHAVFPSESQDTVRGAQAESQPATKSTTSKGKKKKSKKKKRTVGKKNHSTKSTEPKSSTHVREGKAQEHDAANPKSNSKFDFVVAGFPKCGTTSLLKAFERHPETAMASREQCALASPVQADPVVIRKLDETLEDLLNVSASNNETKLSFKCPTALYNQRSIHRMKTHSPEVKFVIGMRHPVRMVESFYNYRIMEIHSRGLDEHIPSLHEVLASDHPWKGVSLPATRFELFLMQLGKVTMTSDEVLELGDYSGMYDLAIIPSSFKIFLYTTDQLDDSDQLRSLQFRSVLQDFLELQRPIPAFGHENKNHHVGRDGYDDSINICHDQFFYVREQLVFNARRTAVWLRNSFIRSPDVVVANRDHFLETLTPSPSV